MLRIDEFIGRNKQVIVLALGLCALAASYIFFYSKTRTHDALSLVLLITGFCAILICIGAYILLKKGVALEKVFLVVFVLIGLIYMGIFAPMKAPDEQSHYAAAYRYSNVLLGQDGLSDSFVMRTCDEQEMRYWFADQENLDNDYAELVERFSWFNQDASLTTMDNVSGYGFSIQSRPPQMHISAAIGLALGRALGLGAIPVIYLGRLTALAVFALLAYWAIRICPVGKIVLIGICFLPRTIELATSFSYDGPIIAMALILSACCIRSILKKGPISKGEIGQILLWVALLAPCKTIYALLAVLAFFIPRNRFANRRTSLLFKGSVIGVALIVLAILSASRVASVASGGSGSTDYYSLSMALDDPLHALAMWGNTIFETKVDGALRFSDQIREVFGGKLGTHGTMVGPWSVVLGFVLLFCAGLFSSREKIEGFTYSLRTASVLVFVLIGAGAMASMQFGYTPADSNYIKGAQGRYFIPALPLLATAFVGAELRIPRDLSKALIMGYILLNLYYCGWMLANIIVR